MIVLRQKEEMETSLRSLAWIFNQCGGLDGPATRGREAPADLAWSRRESSQLGSVAEQRLNRMFLKFAGWRPDRASKICTSADFSSLCSSQKKKTHES